MEDRSKKIITASAMKFCQKQKPQEINMYMKQTGATDKLHHLSMWHVSQAEKISFAQSRLRVLSSIISPLERKELEQTASWLEIKRKDMQIWQPHLFQWHFALEAKKRRFHEEGFRDTRVSLVPKIWGWVTESIITTYLFFSKLVSGRNPPNPAIWLVPRAGGFLRSCPLTRAESLAASFTSLFVVCEWAKLVIFNHFSFKTCAIINIS